MKKHAFALIPILLALALILIPVVMVYFYRSEFETYEISEVDVHLAEIQNHVRIFVDQNGVDESQLPKAMSSYMLRHSEYGSLIILDSEYELLFPEDPPSRRARGALAEEFAEAIQQGTLQNNSYFDTAEGASLRVSFSGLQGRESGTLYVIAYFDTDNSLAQIDRLESIYLQITVFSALFLLIVVVLFYWDYYRYNRLLSEEILRIGSGSLEPLAVPLSIGASEKLRRSINTALEQIKLTSSRRETLTRSVSHFLRNRLTAIDGYAQGIETGVFSPGEAAVKIRMESFTMEELLHNISVYSFIKEQTLPMNDEILYLSNEIEACFRKYSDMAEQKNVSLALLPCGGEAAVKGSESLMETILANLVSNAIRFASSKVTVSVTEEAEQVLVRVEDDGKGISEKDLPHLFQPMYKGRQGNIGLGLSVANDAARYMGGSLKAENRPEGGAVFILSLPAL